MTPSELRQAADDCDQLPAYRETSPREDRILAALEFLFKQEAARQEAEIQASLADTVEGGDDESPG